MRARDTTLAAAEAQEDAYRRIGEAGRLHAALELSDLTHAFAVAGMQARNPGMSGEEAKHALAKLLYDTARQ